MGAAEVIAFEAVRASKQWDTLRYQLHERFAQWLDTLETQWHEPPSTLPEVTAPVWALRQQLTGGITATIVTQAHAGERQRTQARGPKGTRGLTVQEHVRRTVETMVGPVALERPYFYCRACRAGLSPLDDALGGGPGGKQLDMHHAAAQLVTAVPYEPAQSLCGDLTGRHCGSERLHTVTTQVAEGLTVLDVAPSRTGDRAPQRRCGGRALSPSGGGAGRCWGLCAAASRQGPGARRGAQGHAGPGRALAGAVARGQGLSFLPPRG